MSAARMPIAIVGMACRLPGADGPAALWRLLEQGKSALGPVPARRREVLGMDPGVAQGGFLKAIDVFDASFFRISPKEARAMDPQQRLLLEVAWEALEDARIDTQSLRGTRCGVFVGVSASGYGLHSAQRPGPREAQQLSGTMLCAAANRISYFLDLRGPSLAVDTACSSSSMSVHLACQSLQFGDATLALAGGVNLILDDFVSAALDHAGVLAADGRCKTFDARADGYVRGEGAGLLVLKPLEAALRDGDRIYAQILASAVNHDGASNGLLAPNGKAQQALLEHALAQAAVAPAELDYIEAHGTGTLLGDPVETQAIGRVLAQGRGESQRCTLGSIKTNIGHLEAAAGVASLIKVALMLHHGRRVPSIHFEAANPYIRLERQPFEIQLTAEPWTRRERRRVAGVSSFGIGGSNAHVVLADAPEATGAQPLAGRFEAQPELLVLSGRSEGSLRTLMAAHVEQLGDAHDLRAYCRSASRGRTHLPYRVSVSATSGARMAAALARAQPSSPVSAQAPPKVVWLFTGQGAHYAGMGAGLYRREPVFREAIDRCASELDAQLDRPLTALLFGDASELLSDTTYAQPALFALEFALSELWRARGVQPDVVLGHSVGEIAAACVAGCLSLPDALTLVAARGRLMGALPRGGMMLAARTTPQHLRDSLPGGRVAVAAHNGPAQVVASGPAEEVRALGARLSAEDVAVQTLEVSHAFHSPLMEPMVEELSAVAESLALRRPTIPFASTVTGDFADEAITEPSYWARHALDTVCFAEAMEAIAARGAHVFVEIGPQPTLIALARHCLPTGQGQLLPSLRRGDEDATLESLGRLYCLGAAVDWAQVHGERRAADPDLPKTPFQRERYWLDLEPAPARTPSAAPVQSTIQLGHSEIHDGLVAAISQVTGYDADALQAGARLDELGISSIDRLDIWQSLHRRWPQLSADQQRLAALETLEDLHDLVAASWPIGAPAGPPARHIVHSIERGGPGRSLCAALTVDEAHPFFFDHPYDHVPGVLFAEGIQQLAEATWRGRFGADASVGLRKISLSFERWGELSVAQRIEARQLRWQGDGLQIAGDIVERDSGERCVKFRVEVGATPVPSTAVMTTAAEPAAGTQSLTHKLRAENVLVGPMTPAPRGTQRFTSRLPPQAHFLRSEVPPIYTATHLLELVRQAGTSLAHGSGEAALGEHFIFLSARVKLTRALLHHETLTLRAAPAEGSELGELRLGHLRVQLEVDGAVVGEVSVLGGTADDAEYHRQRFGRQVS